MKKFLIFIFIYLSITSLSYPQVGRQIGGGFFFLNKKLGWATIFEYGTSGSRTFRTYDGGNSWLLQTELEGFGKLQFVSDFIGYAAFYSGNKLLKTIDRGNSWNTINTPLGLANFYFLNADFGYCKSDFGSSFLLKTTNGGISWKIITYLENASGGLWVHGKNDISVGGGEYIDTIYGYIMRTKDEGKTWVKDYLNSPVGVIMYIDSITGFAEAGARFYKTTNGGTNWFKDTVVNNMFGDSLGVFKFYFTDSICGYIEVYDHFAIKKISLFKTVNGGKSWTSLWDYTPDSVRSGYYFLDSTYGFTILKSEKFCRTTDGGYTWDCIPLNVVTVVEEYDNYPADYYLSQNYPNPFNPNTNIKFSLPEGSVTTIKVYDILGEEKATLLNEYKSAGSYTAIFDGKNLPSGVYIYTITSGSFKQSRKMVLMK